MLGKRYCAKWVLTVQGRGYCANGVLSEPGRGYCPCVLTVLGKLYCANGVLTVVGRGYCANGVLTSAGDRALFTRFVPGAANVVGAAAHLLRHVEGELIVTCSIVRIIIPIAQALSHVCGKGKHRMCSMSPGLACRK